MQGISFGYVLSRKIGLEKYFRAAFFYITLERGGVEGVTSVENAQTLLISSKINVDISVYRSAGLESNQWYL